MTRNILIVGAAGAIAREVIPMLDRVGCELTLYLRDPGRLAGLGHDTVAGDARDADALRLAMRGQDVVYANLSGDLPAQAAAIIAAMRQAGVSKLIFITSMGVHDEVPGETYGAILDPYRKATALIEASGLDYTILRPAWLNDADEIAYGLTTRAEPFANSDLYLSRKSVADLVTKLATTPGYGHRESIGIHRI